MLIKAHSHFKTLHCMSCQVAIPPQSIPGHLQKKHSKTLTKKQILDLSMVVEKYHITVGTDVRIPVAGGPPVEGLALHPNKFACVACNACQLNFKTFQNHWYKEHKDVELPAKNGFKKAAIQTFFSQPQNFFEVDPTLTFQSTTDPFHLYLKTQVPKMQPSDFIPPPTSSLEIPPLLHAMEWHLHLKDHISDKQKLRSLLELKSLPGLQDKGILGKLRTAVKQYMEEVRKVARSAPFSVRCILMEWPRLVFFCSFSSWY